MESIALSTAPGQIVATGAPSAQADVLAQVQSGLRLPRGPRAPKPARELIKLAVLPTPRASGLKIRSSDGTVYFVFKIIVEQHGVNVPVSFDELRLANMERFRERWPDSDDRTIVGRVRSVWYKLPEYQLFERVP